MIQDGVYLSYSAKANPIPYKPLFLVKKAKSPQNMSFLMDNRCRVMLISPIHEESHTPPLLIRSF